MSPSEFSEFDERYLEAVGHEAIRRLEDGEPLEDIAEDIMRYLREKQYGLTDEEYALMLGGDPEKIEERLGRLDTAVMCIVRSGTLIGHAPDEALRSKTHVKSEKTWLERLTSGHPDDFVIVINEIDQALGRPGG